MEITRSSQLRADDRREGGHRSEGATQTQARLMAKPKQHSEAYVRAEASATRRDERRGEIPGRPPPPGEEQQ